MTKEKIIAKLKTFLDTHDLSIGGCGCCRSPWLTHNDDEGKVDWDIDEFTHTSHTKEVKP